MGRRQDNDAVARIVVLPGIEEDLFNLPGQLRSFWGWEPTNTSPGIPMPHNTFLKSDSGFMMANWKSVVIVYLKSILPLPLPATTYMVPNFL